MCPPKDPASPATTGPDSDQDRTVSARLRVTNSTVDTLRAFTSKHGVSNDEAVVGLIEAYERLTQYRYSAETGHLIAELRKLDADLFSLVTLNLQMMELVRSLQAADYHAMTQLLEAAGKRVSR